MTSHELPAIPTLGPQTLGEALRLLRHRARVSRDHLAATARVSAGAISNYENDVSVPPAPTLRRVCRALAEALERPVELLWVEVGALLDHYAQGEAGPSGSRDDGQQ
jgi:transcriptional regulator with XRE-family HTH domain